jgi:hypothetical protein
MQETIWSHWSQRIVIVLLEGTVDVKAAHPFINIVPNDMAVNKTKFDSVSSGSQAICIGRALIESAWYSGRMEFPAVQWFRQG